MKPFILGMALAFPLSMVAPLAATAQNSAKPLPGPDQQFLNKLAQEDMSEIRLAHLALRRSSNPQVKQYADTILSSDPSMQQQAEKIAKRHQGIAPKRASAEEQHEFQRLSKLNGKQFDKKYIKYEATKQQEDLILVKGEAKNSQSPKTKSFAAKEKPKVAQAATKARQIASAMGVQLPSTLAEK